VYLNVLGNLFCVGNKTIEVNGQEFSLGELSAECLNITVDDYADLRKVSIVILYKKAKDPFHTAETEVDTSYEAFEQMLQSENLYPLCGVVRKSKPRGRPKRG